jgi:hypothetical protein
MKIKGKVTDGENTNTKLNFKYKLNIVQFMYLHSKILGARNHPFRNIDFGVGCVVPCFICFSIHLNVP